MKKLILAAALLLAVASANSTSRKFQDPIPYCPPFCGSGNVVSVG